MSDNNAVPEFDEPRADFEYDDEGDVDLGACCACGATIGVRNVVMLHQTAPVEGTGWGCAVCGLPPNGALAVLCDRCIDAGVDAQRVVKGYMDAGGRIGVDEYAHEPFEHNRAGHAEVFGWLN